MTTEEHLKEIKDFLKLAWCIDGECKYIGFTETIDGQKIVGFELSDSNRGKFKVYLTN